jgi:hypothetical protein
MNDVSLNTYPPNFASAMEKFSGALKIRTILPRFLQEQHRLLLNGEQTNDEIPNQKRLNK